MLIQKRYTAWLKVGSNYRVAITRSQGYVSWPCCSWKLVKKFTGYGADQKNGGRIFFFIFLLVTFPPVDCQQLRKKVLFYYQKLSQVRNQIPRKSLQVLRFSHDLIRLFIKKLKKFHKKNIFSMILLAIILLPLKYPI